MQVADNQVEKNPDGQCGLDKLGPANGIPFFSRITGLILGKMQRILCNYRKAHGAVPWESCKQTS